MAGQYDPRFCCPVCGRAPWAALATVEIARDTGRLWPRRIYECASGHLWTAPDLTDEEEARYPGVLHWRKFG